MELFFIDGKLGPTASDATPLLANLESAHEHGLTNFDASSWNALAKGSRSAGSHAGRCACLRRTWRSLTSLRLRTRAAAHAKVIVALAAWAALSLLTVVGAIGLSMPLRMIVAAVDVILLSILFSNPVWRFVWNQTGPIGRWLSQAVYPDLNGTYDVVLESNWPMVKRMLDAARGEAQPFNPFDVNDTPPKLLRVELEACIEQTWFEINMWMYPKTSDAIIKRSGTIATIPIRRRAHEDKELIYIFEQENERRAPTDDETHQGAARLKIDRQDSSRLSGEYWNNRAWRRGVNAAGRLTLVRRRTTPPCI